MKFLCQWYKSASSGSSNSVATVYCQNHVETLDRSNSATPRIFLLWSLVQYEYSSSKTSRGFAAKLHIDVGCSFLLLPMSHRSTIFPFSLKMTTRVLFSADNSFFFLGFPTGIDIFLPGKCFEAYLQSLSKLRIVGYFMLWLASSEKFLYSEM